MDYGLIGRQLGHSWSPWLHQQLGSWPYELLALPADTDVKAFFARREFRGVNVTIPYKRLAAECCDVLDPQAKAIGAVNTVVVRGGRLYGWNTDLGAFEALLAAHGISLAGQRVMILGTGGTSSTVEAAARHQGAAEILKVSRTPGPGQLSYAQAAQRPEVQILINTTPAGMYPQNGQCLLPLDGLTGCRAVVDVVYNPFKTELLLRAEERGLTAVGGLEMLTAQAVAAAGYFLDREFPKDTAARLYHGLMAQQANVSLIGMPGCGKSSVGRLLAKRLGKPLVSLDDEVERRTGMSIPQIFAQQGEAGFRRIEAEVVREVSARQGQVLACGGGVVETPGNIRMLRQNGPILLIERELDRLPLGGGRPLSVNRQALQEIKARREPLYCAAADGRVSNNKSIEEAAQAAEEAFYEAVGFERPEYQPAGDPGAGDLWHGGL